jgi:peroxiredoxin Q/BCP
MALPAGASSVPTMAKLPAFSLPGSDGAVHSPATLRGAPAILYFYPKDATPGCTQEACDFRNHQPDFSALNLRVFGISPDPLASHARFIAKLRLRFVLLADEQHTLAEALGVWAEKKLYGRTYMGIVRSTFLIGADSTILAEWRAVKVVGHAAAVLAAAKEFL